MIFLSKKLVNRGINTMKIFLLIPAYKATRRLIELINSINFINLKKLSVILPCFNESRNLPYVLEKFGKVINSDDIELIIVDNGSEDNTLKILEELIPKYSFAKLEKVKVNKGYGYGIKSGLKVAQGKYLSWTHADMQTDPNDVIKALNLIENCSSRDKLFIKGKRKGRPWSDEFFTIGMSFFESILKIPVEILNQVLCIYTISGLNVSNLFFTILILL